MQEAKIILFLYLKNFLKSLLIKPLFEIKMLAVNQRRFIEGIEVIFSFSPRARLIRISINSKSQVKLVLPRHLKIEDGEQFLLSKISWVKNSLKKMLAREQLVSSYIKLSAEEFLARNKFLITRCRDLAVKYGFKVNKISLKRQKSLWGSCSANNNISLNSNLVFVSDALIDYVILHELVHTKIKNHSIKFWSLLEKILPNARALDRDLKKHMPNKLSIA